MQTGDELDSVKCMVDDSLIYRSTYQRHNVNLHHFLQVCMKNHIKLKREKVALRKPGVTFHLHIPKSDGANVDRGKIKAVQVMLKPKDVRTEFFEPFLTETFRYHDAPPQAD